MDKRFPNPSPKIILISLAVNLLICLTILPYVMQPDSLFNIKELIETLFWQAISLIGWPVALIVGALNYLRNRNLSDLRTALFVSIYPAIWLIAPSLIFIKKGKWILLVILHLLLILSFFVTWLSVLKGYDFMVG